MPSLIARAAKVWRARSPWLRYFVALALAVAAQLSRLPIRPPTLMPYITYVPFIVLSAAFGGFGPGALATILCTLESIYFATAPLHSFAVADPRLWAGIGMLAFTGLVIVAVFEWLRRALAASEAMRTELGRQLEARHQMLGELRSAYAESEANHSLLAAVLTAQTDPILVCGADGTVVRANPAASANWGFDPTGWHGAGVMDKLGIPGGFDASLTKKALLGETAINEEQRAGDRIFETSSAPMRDAAGRILGAVVVSHDVTRRRRMKEALESTVRELESALEEKTVLLKEVHHRVKNNLAVISSVLGMKAEVTVIPEAQRALAESQQRVQSIALIHEHLYGRDHLNRINFSEYAEELLKRLQEVYVGEPRRITIRSQVEAIELGVDRAMPCALILNELVSNACKHGFPNGRSGEVRVGFRESEPGALELSVENDGIGCPPPPEAGNGNSLGLRIVHILARQLDGAFRQESPALSEAGTRFVLRFPAGAACAVNRAEHSKTAQVG
jgi:two-component system, sensor histidine kinase PdtaS